MYRRLIWLCICLLGMIASGHWVKGWLIESPATGQPVADVPSTFQDFGVVRQGEVILARFSVANTGSRRLILVEHGTSCCNGPPTVHSIIVKPGRTHWLEQQVDTGLWCGRMRHYASYTTNDPQQPLLTITVCAMVEPQRD